MPTYVLMTKLGPVSSGAEEPGRRERGQRWKEAVDRLCPNVKWISHFALLGPYDFMDIYEAPSDEVAMKVSMLSRAKGAVIAESWPAVRYGDFLQLVEDVEAETRRDA
ncbi:MAG TPA: GYD domain-containing protein [Polyangiaceae bacterium]|jgi:uncharacterized protein with GYD domain|nr:GYD domain-containing protein [Polyangiaceae bacterium]